MNLRLSLSAVFLAAAAAALASVNAQAQNAGTVAARVMSVQCNARLKKKGTTGDAALSSPRDVALGLSAGDQVECIGDGYLQVLVSDGTKKITASQKWFTIPPLPADPQYPKEDREITDALKSYGISGATRGMAAASRILWPSENSVVLPEHFAIRWKPVTQKITLSILSDAKDVTVWGPVEADGQAGSLKSDALNTALGAYKAKPGSQGLILTLTLGKSSDWEETHFSLLRGRQEQELNAQLDFWEKNTNGLALRLGRGYTFLRSKLFAEAAEEYESALNIAPGSTYLLNQAIEANRLAGMPGRAEKLQSRLSSLPVAANK